ncbi:MAG TPA: hypothetical protein VNO21_25810, partial [Polyangiaceae bacterium]|nr:hypothetical protein [Polyangiaceae bacterium]
MSGQNSSPRTLRARRTDPDAARFDPHFFEKDPLFWPIARAASVFIDPPDAPADPPEWPDVEAYARAFGDAPPAVLFEPSRPKPRRSRKRARAQNEQADPVVDLDSGYDGRITLARRVPTRPR